MDIEYFDGWNWQQRRGLDPLSEKKVVLKHAKGETYIAYLEASKLVLTLRPETSYVALGFAGPDGQRLGGVAFVLDQKPHLEAVDVRQHNRQVVRLQGGHGPRMTVSSAPFEEPTEFESKAIPVLNFPEVGEYAEWAKLPRDPWAYVELPAGFDPPQPMP